MADETDTDTNEVSELRKAAEGGAKARAEAELARKELAFVKAGINTDTKPAQALLQSYSGELTADAIKAEAAEWGLVEKVEAPAPTPDKPDYTDDAELQNMRDATAGRPAPIEEIAKSAFDLAGDGYIADRKDGRSQNDALNRAYGSFIKEAARGNPTAIFDPHEWERQAAEHGHGQEFAQ
jgi:hypothetical protein